MARFPRVVLTVAILAAVVLLNRRQPWAQPAGPRGLPPNRVSITDRGDVREIKSNGIPDHEPGRFPNRNNPNTIREQDYDFQLALRPEKSNMPNPLGMNPFGIAVNGVPFDPGAAEFWNGDRNWQYEALSGQINLGLDASHAHVQPNGAYHYHGVPAGLVERLGRGERKMTLVGYAADGFPIYSVYGFADPKSADSDVRKLESSYRLKKGARPGGPRGRYDGSFVQDYEYVAGAGDLDECNGREGVTPEYPAGTYYYVITEEFPFIPRLLRGTPDASFRRGPPGGGPPGRRGPPGGPPRRPPRA